MLLLFIERMKHTNPRELSPTLYALAVRVIRVAKRRGVA